MDLTLYLFLFFFAYICIAFILPSYRVYKSTGINPFVFGRSGNTHDYSGAVMKLLIALSLMNISVASFLPGYYFFFVPVLYLESSIFEVTGLILIHLSFLWTVIAQMHMGKNWRIGIDKANKTGLVTKGIFKISRNPVFIGMILTVIGLFLLLPNVITFFVAGCTYIILNIQIRLEEEFLLKEHGQTYFEYCSRVRRLI